MEVYNSIFNTREESNKFEVHRDTFDKFPFSELKDELEEIIGLSVITLKHLQHEILRPKIIQAYKELRSEKSSTDGFLILLKGYARSPFRVFES